jgi:hypothetical protein
MHFSNSVKLETQRSIYLGLNQVKYFSISSNHTGSGTTNCRATNCRAPDSNARSSHALHMAGLQLNFVRVLIKDETCGPAEAHKTRIAEYLLIKIDAFHLPDCVVESDNIWPCEIQKSTGTTLNTSKVSAAEHAELFTIC